MFSAYPQGLLYYRFFGQTQKRRSPRLVRLLATKAVVCETGAVYFSHWRMSSQATLRVYGQGASWKTY
jgi:hypothetical protein